MGRGSEVRGIHFVKRDYHSFGTVCAPYTGILGPVFFVPVLINAARPIKMMTATMQMRTITRV